VDVGGSFGGVLELHADGVGRLLGGDLDAAQLRRGVEHRDEQRLGAELLQVGADLGALLDGLLEALLAEQVGDGPVGGVVGGHQRGERIERRGTGRPQGAGVHEHEALAVDDQRVARAALGEQLAQDAIDAVERGPVEVERGLEHGYHSTSRPRTPGSNKPLTPSPCRLPRDGATRPAPPPALALRPMSEPTNGAAPRLPDSTLLGAVYLRVRDLPATTGFYREVLGLEVRAERDGGVMLGTPTRDLVGLIAAPEGASAPRAPGLYHLALLLPDRAALGRFLKQAVRTRAKLQGASDH